MGFGHRIKHPPTDPVNSLLSFGYALAFYNLYALIRARGLHPYVGHLHAMRDWHPALASDLLEEFRAPVVDSLVLYLVNSKIIIESDFYRASEGEHRGGCYLRDAARKTFLKHFEQKMASPIIHPGTGESVDWRRAMDFKWPTCCRGFEERSTPTSLWRFVNVLRRELRYSGRQAADSRACHAQKLWHTRAVQRL